MPAISASWPALRCAAIVFAVLSIGEAIPKMFLHPGDTDVHAQVASSPNPGSVELEDVLFVQDPHLPGGKKGIDVYWIPKPIQRYCLGKTTQQCISLDYCLRTTNTNDSRCRNLHAEMARLRPYPRGMRPSRVHCITFFQVSQIGGSQLLQNLYDTAPKDALNRISASTRIKARIRYTIKPDDDDFDVLQFLAVPPF
jgi:hypothetical protein